MKNGAPGRNSRTNRSPTRFRVYVDTSVFGGREDPEFAADSRRFFHLARRGRITLLVSPVVLEELARAPASVVAVLRSLPRGRVEPVEVTAGVIRLRDAYVAAGIVTPRYVDDATHVAAATAARADAIVSWNFRHIVRLDKMRAYNRVNLETGYGLLSIVTPREVRFDDDE